MTIILLWPLASLQSHDMITRSRPARAQADSSLEAEGVTLHRGDPNFNICRTNRQIDNKIGELETPIIASIVTVVIVLFALIIAAVIGGILYSEFEHLVSLQASCLTQSRRVD